MKKMIIIFFSVLILSGCREQERSYDEIKNEIINNFNKIEENVYKKPSYDYIKNKYYRNIVKSGYDAVSIIIDLYYNDDLETTSKLVGAYAIEDITGCHLNDIYDLSWKTADEFFEMWKNNNCSNKHLESLTSNVQDLLEKYPDFSNAVKECNINVPIFKEMIPQGVTVMKDYILITAYDNKGKNNSKCYVLNKNGEIVNIVKLDTYSHVGGIDYDEVNDLIWIPGDKGSLNVYDAKDFLEKKEVIVKSEFNNISAGLVNYQDKSKNQIAYLSVDGSYIYIGGFSLFGKSSVKKFLISENLNGEISLEFINEFKLPAKVQGITFYAFRNVKFMILSKSYGRHNSSRLYLYRYDEAIEDYTLKDTMNANIELPPMLEQVTMNGYLYTIFESNATKYDNCNDKVGSICLLNIDKMVDGFLEEESVILRKTEDQNLMEWEKANETQNGSETIVR